MFILYKLIVPSFSGVTVTGTQNNRSWTQAGGTDSVTNGDYNVFYPSIGYYEENAELGTGGMGDVSPTWNRGYGGCIPQNVCIPLYIHIRRIYV